MCKYLIILLLIIINGYWFKNICVKYHRLLGGYSISAYIGDVKLRSSFIIDLNKTFILTSNFYYAAHISRTARNVHTEIIQVNDKEAQCIYAEDIFSFNTINNEFIKMSHPSVPLYVFDYQRFMLDEYLGLGYNTNITNSLIHILYNEKLIDSLEFSIFPNDTCTDNNTGSLNEEGLLVLGKVTNDLLMNFPYLLSIPIVNNNSWMIRVNKINIGLYEYNVPSTQQDVIFNPNEKFIYVPKTFMDYLTSNIFNKLIIDGTCGESDIDPAYIIYSYTCNCKILDTFPNMYFIFSNNKQLFINSKHLFSIISNKCYFNMIHNPSLQNQNTFIFGNSITKHYILTFNYNSNTISIYSKHNSQHITSHQFNIVRCITVLNISMLLINLILLLLCLYKDAKHLSLLLITIYIIFIVHPMQQHKQQQ